MLWNAENVEPDMVMNNARSLCGGEQDTIFKSVALIDFHEKVVFEQIIEGGKNLTMCKSGKSSPGRGNRQCKDPSTLQTSQGASVLTCVQRMNERRIGAQRSEIKE